MPHSGLGVILVALALCGTAISAESKAVWIDVPFVSQTGEGCGAASIAMVMQYWQQRQSMAQNPAASYEQIDRTLDSPGGHGIFASAMERYFQQNGYHTFVFMGQPADLAEHLAKGRPLIAALKAGSGSELHYVVVAGIDPVQRIVLLNDPAQRKLLKEDKARFEKEWKAAGHWTLLAVPDEPAHK